MKMGVYAIYDRVAEECGPVWTSKNDAVAVRNANIQLKEVRADDFWLYKLGEFDSEEIRIDGFEKGKQVPLGVKEE